MPEGDVGVGQPGRTGEGDAPSWGGGEAGRGGGVGRDAQGLKAPLEAELSTNQLLYLVQVVSS